LDPADAALARRLPDGDDAEREGSLRFMYSQTRETVLSSQPLFDVVPASALLGE
jgi:hypothetical protein